MAASSSWKLPSSALRPELESTRTSPSKKPHSLRQQLSEKVGKVIAVIDQLQRSSVLSDAQLDFPMIVAIGPESCGKSSVLERLAHWSLFPRSEGICTRMPIELRLIHLDDAQLFAFCKKKNLKFNPKEGYCRMTYEKNDRPFGSSPEMTSPFIQLSAMQQKVKYYHDKFVRQANGSLSGIIFDRLVLEIRSTAVVNLRLVDLPGIISARHSGEPEDITQQTMQLTRHYLKQPHTLVLGVVSATEGFRTSTAMGLVQEFRKEMETIGVLTKADRAADSRPEARRNPMRELKAKLDGTSGDMISLPMGVVATRNHDTVYDHDLSLDAVAAREAQWFSETMPGYAEQGKVGIHALSEKLASLLLRYTIVKWVPEAIKKIDSAISSKHSQMQVQCGTLPSDGGGLERYLLRVVSQANNYWSSIRYFEPESCWVTPRSHLLSFPLCLQEGKDLSSFLNWKDLKDTIFQSSEVEELLDRWTERIRCLWEAPFVPGHIQSPHSSSNEYLERFQTLRGQLAQLLPFRVIKKAKDQLFQQLADLCRRFDARPTKRNKFPSSAQNLCRTVFYEEVFFPALKVHGFHRQGIPTPSWICGLLSRYDTEQLLQESDDWLAKRKSFVLIISNLKEAKTEIQQMVAKAQASH